ncbi:hypothetical protein T492DRAFT_842225 [Pavlovales sp. CCMP2436]|nr:hypothetical protein T492DRAFT_842225 [Pavlovales sp. CCMP2436]
MGLFTLKIIKYFLVIGLFTLKIIKYDYEYRYFRTNQHEYEYEYEYYYFRTWASYGPLNNVGELWPILNFLEEDFFADQDEFLAQCREALSVEQDLQLKAKLRPFVLQRSKAEVGQAEVELGLAPMEETTLLLEVTHFQKRCYRSLLEQNRELLLKGTADNIYVSGPSFNNLSLQLRLCCNHPFLIKVPYKCV